MQSQEVNENYAVQMSHITKTFGSNRALDDVHLSVRRQSIHAILGENGAGKTTLMNILYGLYTADTGEIFLNGVQTDIKDPTDAIRNGIGMVHQHFMLVENFTVAENIVLGSEITKGAGVLDFQAARKRVQEIVNEYGFEVDPDALIEDISVGMQQRVEILKALYRGADILIFDEPTAVLTPQEIEKLIHIMHQLTERGKTVIIITHKLKEILDSADECTIIRRGKYIDTVKVKDCNEQDLASMMVGHHVDLNVTKTPAEPGEVVFQVEDLHVKDERGIETVKGLNLQLRKGEIVGIAGVDGNGQDQLIDAITGMVKAESGTISVKGTQIQNTEPANVIAHGVRTIPSDRHRFGLVLPFTVAENFVLDHRGDSRFGKGNILNMSGIRTFAQDLIKKFDIRPDDCVDEQAGGLSGGNQQKIIIAREVSGEPDVIIAVQPTRGLDVGAIEFVHNTLIEQRDRGAAILLVSFELDEVMDVSDTIDVIYDGQIVGSFKQGTVDEDQIGLLMAGGEA